MKKDTRNNSKDTRNNSPDSKLDPDHSWGGLNFVKEIVKFFEAKVDTKNLPSDETKNQASAALVGAGTQPKNDTIMPSVLDTQPAPVRPLVSIKTIKEYNPSMPAALSPGSTRSRSPDSAAGVFGGQEPSSPCRNPHEISTSTPPTFIEAIGANFSDVFSAFGGFQVNPDTPTKPQRSRTGSAAPSSSRRSKSPTSEITAAARSSSMRSKSPTSEITPDNPPAPPTPAAAPSVVSTQNKEVKNKTGCLPKPNFLAKLFSKFSLRDRQDTDKKSVVSATPSRPASTIAESERGSTTAGSATRRSERGSATARSTTARSTTAGSATPSRPASTIRPESPARSTTTRDGSPRKPATKRLKELLKKLWSKGKFHKSDGKCGDGRNENIQGAAAIALDGARKLKNTPKKISGLLNDLGSGLYERISKFATSISSIKLPQLPERNEVRQQPASFTRQSSPSRKSFSQIFSENTDWLRKLSSNINQQPHQPNSYSPPSNNGKSSLFSRASELFQGIKKDYADYKKGKEYTSYRSSYRGTGRIPNPTMPSQADIKKVASTLANNASWVCRIAGDGARDAAGYACSSAARRAEAAKSYAKRASNWVDNYRTNTVHATWWPGR